MGSLPKGNLSKESLKNMLNKSVAKAFARIRNQMIFPVLSEILGQGFFEATRIYLQGKTKKRGSYSWICP